MEPMRCEICGEETAFDELKMNNGFCDDCASDEDEMTDTPPNNPHQN